MKENEKKELNQVRRRVRRRATKEDRVQELMERTNGKISEEYINNIIDKFGLENFPIIEVTTDPMEFERQIVETNDVFEHSWAGSMEKHTQSETLYGDCIPGILNVYQYSNNGDNRTPKKTYNMSDFSVNEWQAVLVNSSYNDQYNGANENYETTTIYIYIPEKEYAETMSYKQYVIETKRQELSQEIATKTEGKITEEVISQIVNSIDLLKEDVPNVEVENNPKSFEARIRQTDDVFEHSWAGSKEEHNESKTLYGDCVAGEDKKYQYSDNGDSQEPNEIHTMSDFSMNKPQIILVNRNYNNQYDGADITDNSSSIEIYIPEEREYDVISFKEMLQNEKLEALVKANQKLDKDIKEIEGQLNKQI